MESVSLWTAVACVAAAQLLQTGLLRVLPTLLLILRGGRERQRQARALQREVTELRLALKGISAQDEFARYMRTERQIDKAQAQLQALAPSLEQTLKHAAVDRAAAIAVQVIIFVVLLLLSWRYNVAIPPGVLGPLGDTFGWHDTVPAMVWMFACHQTANALKILIGVA